MAHTDPRTAQPQPRRRKRRRRVPAQQRPSSWRTNLAIGVGVVFGGLIAAVAILLVALSPAKLIQDQVIAQVKAATGRDFVVEGGSGLTFWPSLAVSLKNVRLAAPKGMTAPDTLRAKRIAVQVELFPLLTGRAKVSDIVIENPQIDLRVAKNGQATWQFGSVTAPGKTRYAQAAGKASDSALTTSRDQATPQRDGLMSPADYKTVSTLLARVDPKDLIISGGTVTYTDARSGTRERIENINLRLSPRLAKETKSLRDYEFAAKGDFQFRGRKFDLTASASTLDSFVLAGTGNVVATLTSSDRIKLRVELKPRNLGRNPAAAFNIALTALDLDQLSALGGVGLPEARKLGRLELDVRGGRASASAISASKVRLNLGDTALNGDLKLALTGPRPKLTGTVNSTGTLDIEKLTAAFSTTRTAAPKPTGDQGSKADDKGNAAKPRSINDLLRRAPAPQVKGDTRRYGWSTQPIDTAALRTVDADINVTLNGVLVSGLTIGRTQSRIRLTAGALRTDITRMALYQGTATGLITADPKGASLAIANDVKLTDVQIQPLLKDIAQFDTIAGRGDITFSLRTLGNSEYTFVSALNGSAKINFQDGALVGWNIAELMRNVGQGQFSGLEKTPDQKTDFSSLTATFTIKNGIATTNDMLLLSPLLRVKAKGDVKLPVRELDLTVTPELIATLQGQGRNSDKSGVGVPVTVKGDWSNPSVSVDVTSAVTKGVNAIREQYKKNGVKGVIEGLTGKNGKDAKKILEGLFGR